MAFELVYVLNPVAPYDFESAFIYQICAVSTVGSHSAATLNKVCPPIVERRWYTGSPPPHLPRVRRIPEVLHIIAKSAALPQTHKFQHRTVQISHFFPSIYAIHVFSSHIDPPSISRI